MLNKLNSAGFTLTEVMTTIAIAAILFAIGVPAFTRTLPGLRLADAARQVATDLQHVRMKAIAHGIAHQITFSPSTYVLQRCNGTCTNDSGNIGLPTGITVTASSAPRFESRGTLNTASNITLSNGSTLKYVCVNTVGRVHIQDVTCS